MAHAAKKRVTLNEWLRVGVLRLSRIHFLFAAALGAQIILYDAGKLITPDVVLQRWAVTILFLVGVTVVWYLAHSQNASSNFYSRLVFLLIALDIAVAAFSVYNQRGMDSRGVLLFAIPIIVSAVLLNRVALFATATICIATYGAAAISYFVLHFNEGYKLELYGEVGFYSALFLVLAGLLAVVIRFKEES